MMGGPLGVREERWCNWKWMAVLVLIHKYSEELESQSSIVLELFTFTCGTMESRGYSVSQCAY